MSQNNELHLNNALTEEFKQMLRPYYLTQKLLCSSKYSVKDNFVLPNSRAYCAIALFLLCFTTYMYYSMSLTTSCTIGNLCPLITYMHNLIGHFVTTACIIVQTESAVDLLIRMQGIDRNLRAYGVRNLPIFLRKSWCFIVFVMLLYSLTISISVYNTNNVLWMRYLTAFQIVIFDLNMWYAIFIVEFLSSRLKCLSNLFIGRNGARLRFFEENDACGVFKKILKAFSLSSNLVQYQVLSYIVSTFIDSLMTVQMVIDWRKNYKIPDAYSNISFLYALKFIRNLKNISFVVMFSAACERFYCRVDDVKNDCAVALNEHPQQGAFRKTFKNLLRLCNVRSSKMRLCGLFAVDAALPLRLLGLMATYCIVLLQFAFL